MYREYLHLAVILLTQVPAFPKHTLHLKNLRVHTFYHRPHRIHSRSIRAPLRPQALPFLWIQVRNNPSIFPISMCPEYMHYEH